MTTISTQDRLAADTAMGPVTLLVADLDLELRYYRDVLGLEVLERPDERIEGVARPDVVVLGRADRPVMVLRHTPDLPPTRPGQAGLFHTAILFDTREALAATLATVAARAPQTFVGSADHLVSEAFYLTDPEGNGVELYWDRSRETWQFDADGHVVMDALALDPNGFIRQNITEAALAGPFGRPLIGHVHLQVGDVGAARAFYVDALGFDATAQWHGALFVSAGGYHHHMAMNTWNSAGAGPRASSLGLGEVTLLVPTTDDVGALRERLAHHGVPVEHDGATLHFDDPWRNRIRVRPAS